MLDKRPKILWFIGNISAMVRTAIVMAEVTAVGGTWYTVLRGLYGIRGLKRSKSCSQIITVRKIR